MVGIPEIPPERKPDKQGASAFSAAAKRAELVGVFNQLPVPTPGDDNITWAARPLLSELPPADQQRILAQLADEQPPEPEK